MRSRKGVNTVGGSDITNKMGVQGVCVGGDEDSAMGNRGGSSTMASYLPEGKKTDGQFFGRSQLQMSSSILLLK